jgi:hypothetical protein
MISVDMMTPTLKIETQLTQIRMQLLTATNPLTIKVFVEKITEMLKNLEEDQTKHESVNKKMTLQCAEEEKFRKIEIIDATTAYKASSEAEKKCSTSLVEGKKFLPQLESSVSDYKSQIKIKTDERTVQHKKYIDLQKEWETAITFLKSFLKKIEESLDGKKTTATFIQLNEDLIKHVAKLGRLESLVPIFLALEGNVKTDNSFTVDSGTGDDEKDDADDIVVGKKVSNSTQKITNSTKQIVSNALKNVIAKNNTNITIPINSTADVIKKNFSIITKNIIVKPKPLTTSKMDNLQRIVNDLVIQLVADSKENDMEEIRMIKSYENLVVEFNKIITQLMDNIARVKKQMTEMDACVKREMAIMTTASEKKIRNEKLMSMADRTCLDFVKEFVVATNSRYRQIESVNEILAIIKKRFGEFPPSLVKMINEMESQFKNYINTTQFKKFEDITKTKIADNTSGRALSQN